MPIAKRPIDLFMLEPVEDRVLAHLGTPGRILDIGCGLGEKTRSFNEMGWQAIGIDIDPTKIGEAWRALRSLANTVPRACDAGAYSEAEEIAVRTIDKSATFLLANSETLPFQSETFDAVFSLSTLQYVNPAQAIREANRVLKPGGKAVFIENLAGSPLARMFRMLKRSYRANAKPKSHLTLDTIPQLFEPFGQSETQTYNLTTTSLIALGFLHEAVTRSSEIKLAPRKPANALRRADAKLLARWPKLSRYSWTCLILATKA